MSTEAVLRFRQAVTEDEELQDEIRATAAGGGLDLTVVGARHGFEFTAAELNEVAKEIGGELTDFELEMVAGGEESKPLGERAAPRVGPCGGHTIPAEDPDPSSTC